MLIPDVPRQRILVRKPQSSANAARGGLKPPPAGRLRRAYLHHPNSTNYSASDHLPTHRTPFTVRDTRRVKVGAVRSDLRRWWTQTPVKRLSLPFGSLPARSAAAFRPGQSDLAALCASQDGHVDPSPRSSSLASLQLAGLSGDFDAALPSDVGGRALR